MYIPSSYIGHLGVFYMCEVSFSGLRVQCVELIVYKWTPLSVFMSQKGKWHKGLWPFPHVSCKWKYNILWPILFYKQKQRGGKCEVMMCLAPASNILDV